MGKRLERMKDILWQGAIVAAIPAIFGVAMALKPAPMPDNDRPFWADAAHLQTCRACRSGLTEFNAMPASSLDEQRDVAQEGGLAPPAGWQGREASQTRTALDG